MSIEDSAQQIVDAAKDNGETLAEAVDEFVDRLDWNDLVELLTDALKAPFSLPFGLDWSDIRQSENIESAVSQALQSECNELAEGTE